MFRKIELRALIKYLTKQGKIKNFILEEMVTVLEKVLLFHRALFNSDQMSVNGVNKHAG